MQGIYIYIYIYIYICVCVCVCVYLVITIHEFEIGTSDEEEKHIEARKNSVETLRPHNLVYCVVTALKQAKMQMNLANFHHAKCQEDCKVEMTMDTTRKQSRDYLLYSWVCCIKSESHYDRQSVGQTVLVSGRHPGRATNFSFSLTFSLDICGFDSS
jgi:hypothetical protein